MRYIHTRRARANRVEKKMLKKKKKISASTLRTTAYNTQHNSAQAQHRGLSAHTLSIYGTTKNTRIPNQRYTVQLTLLHTNKTRTCSLGERTNHNGTHFHRFLCRRGSNRTLSHPCAMLCCAVCASAQLHFTLLCCVVTCC